LSFDWWHPGALHHALLLSPLLRITGWLLISVCQQQFHF